MKANPPSRGSRNERNRNEEGETKELLPHEIEADRRLEALLDDLAARTASAPPADFTRRVMEARGFAPWEVRSRRAWRVPLLAASGLAAGTAGLALLPLWSLGPGTALQTWARVSKFAVVSRPVELSPASARHCPAQPMPCPRPFPRGLSSPPAWRPLSPLGDSPGGSADPGRAGHGQSTRTLEHRDGSFRLEPGSPAVPR
jgi:hypothetical protein